MSSFCKATHIFFRKNISIYALFNDQSFNDMLTNNIVSFEQLGPDCQTDLLFFVVFVFFNPSPAEPGYTLHLQIV